MALEHTRQATLPRAFSNAIGSLADLFQKELRLARAELTDKLTTKLQASIWMAAAGLFGLVTLLLVVEAAVFAIASFDIALHWACLIVAAVVGTIAAIAFFKGRSDAQEEMTPTRTIEQVKRDISTAKEQLT